MTATGLAFLPVFASPKSSALFEVQTGKSLVREVEETNALRLLETQRQARPRRCNAIYAFLILHETGFRKTSRRKSKRSSADAKEGRSVRAAATGAEAADGVRNPLGYS
jgi:hypothetical protein